MCHKHSLNPISHTSPSPSSTYIPFPSPFSSPSAWHHTPQNLSRTSRRWSGGSTPPISPSSMKDSSQCEQKGAGLRDGTRMPRILLHDRHLPKVWHVRYSVNTSILNYYKLWVWAPGVSISDNKTVCFTVSVWFVSAQLNKLIHTKQSVMVLWEWFYEMRYFFVKHFTICTLVVLQKYWKIIFEDPLSFTAASSI